MTRLRPYGRKAACRRQRRLLGRPIINTPGLGERDVLRGDQVCCYCGCALTDPPKQERGKRVRHPKSMRTFDHITPLLWRRNNKATSEHNLTASCEACNRSKGTLSLLMFLFGRPDA